MRINPASDPGFLPGPLHVYQWHKEGFDLPQGATLLARGEVFENQAFRLGEAAYAIQFHPEVTSNIMADWMRDSGASLSAPGASPKAQQLEDAKRHNGAIDVWLDRFLDRCLLARLNCRWNDPFPRAKGAL